MNKSLINLRSPRLVPLGLAPLVTILSLMLGLAPPRSVNAWNRSGHYAAALVAWKLLDSDESRQQVALVLESHPHRELFLDMERPEGVNAMEWRFVRAAQWPDWVAKPAGPRLSPAMSEAIVKQYHHPTWHFVNLPLVHPDDRGTFSAEKIREDVLLPYHDERDEPRHVLAALDAMHREYRDMTLAVERRAVALSWILHLTADIHQPLHCCTLLASDKTMKPSGFPPPSGDRGGNRLAIRPMTKDLATTTLHFVWDSQLLGDRTYLEIRGEVERWLADSAPDATASTPKDARESAWIWAKESFELAGTDVYRDGDRWIHAVPIPSGMEIRQISDLDAPTLSRTYLDNVEKISRRRLFQSGQRIARRLTKHPASENR